MSAPARITYDAEGDVLYVTILNRPASRAIEIDGKVWRYDTDGELVGVTFIDFVERFAAPASAGGRQ